MADIVFPLNFDGVPTEDEVVRRVYDHVSPVAAGLLAQVDLTIEGVSVGGGILCGNVTLDGVRVWVLERMAVLNAERAKRKADEGLVDPQPLQVAPVAAPEEQPSPVEPPLLVEHTEPVDHTDHAVADQVESTPHSHED